MNELVSGLAVFGAMFIGVIVLLPVFLLQKAIAENRNEDRRAEIEKQLENEKLL
ncbi:hypothetical protein [Halorubrum depositum]|uniref:hypothetical protein n=1 Tax=Halorubrum depositum TaxID=2583992 RepID=UPI0016434F53|nr:hypothetical protein [Halorubrum depositum]